MKAELKKEKQKEKRQQKKEAIKTASNDDETAEVANAEPSAVDPASEKQDGKREKKVK